MAIDRFRFQAGDSGVITHDLTDDQGAPLSADALVSATLTLWDIDTNAPNQSPNPGIINGRDAQDVLNANDVEIGDGSPPDGHLVWSVQPEDSIIRTDRRQIERHRARFEFATATGRSSYECEIDVLAP